MTPKFLTCSPGVITVDPIFRSGSFGIVRYFEPITSISVLSSFSFNIFAAYQARIQLMAICMLDTASFADMLNQVNNWQSSAYIRNLRPSNDVTKRQQVNCKKNRTQNRSLWYPTTSIHSMDRPWKIKCLHWIYLLRNINIHITVGWRHNRNTLYYTTIYQQERW